MVKLSRTRFTIGFPHERYLGSIVQTVEPDELGEEPNYGELYAKALRTELEPLVRSGEIETQPRDLGEAGGPGIEWDFVSLLVGASIVGGAYSGFRQLTDDLLAIVDKLKRLGDGRVFVDEYTAEILAIDHVASRVTFADTTTRFIAKLRGADDDGPEPDRGYLVGLQVNDHDLVVVVGSDGRVLGVTRDLSIEGIDSLGL